MDDNTIKGIMNFSKLGKENEAIKDRINSDAKKKKKEQEKKDYYKVVRADNFWSNNYIEYESNGDTNKTILIEEYLNKIRPY